MPVFVFIEASILRLDRRRAANTCPLATPALARSSVSAPKHASVSAVIHISGNQGCVSGGGEAWRVGRVVALGRVQAPNVVVSDTHSVEIFRLTLPVFYSFGYEIPELAHHYFRS